MNANNAAQFLPLVQALADGKTIQVDVGPTGKVVWRDIADPVFNAIASEYRIKPEPREWHGRVINTCRNHGNNTASFTIEIDGNMGNLPSHGKLSIREILP